jgi:hypothetical protein
MFQSPSAPKAARQGSLGRSPRSGKGERKRETEAYDYYVVYAPQCLAKVADVISCMERQEEHHQTKTFQGRISTFSKRYRLAFDERYVWD